MSNEDFKATFSTFILSIGHSAQIGLGLMENPESKKVEKNMNLAKYNIDLLGLLKDKTKNNLTPDEDTLLNQILSDLQMKFVNENK